MSQKIVPDAELLIATGCTHCPVVLAGLAELVKAGRIGRLDVVNIAQHPEIAARRGVRGVPWIRIGPFELSGAHSRAELEELVDRAGSQDGLQAYLNDSLESGELDRVIAACRRSPELLFPLLALAGDLETPFAVRIGVGAVLEDLATDDLLTGLTEPIRQLAASPQPQVRADAAHFLGLSGNQEARAELERLAASDEDREVREIARESLAEMGPAPD
jgi:hypothetical protein